MNYEEFKDRIYQELQKVVDDNVSVEQKEVEKNNGIVLDGLTIHSEGKNISPCLYLNYYYDKFKQGAMITEIVEEMLNIFTESKGTPDQELISSTKNFLDFNEVRGNICYKLVNAKMNEELLKDVPHQLFLDLAIVYFVVCKIDDEGIGTVLIRNSMVNQWGVTNQELQEIATSNTVRLFPAEIRSMEDVVLGLIGKEDDCELDMGTSTMYIVTNTKSIQAAATVLYPNLLKDFCKNFSEEGLVILPSSIHEQILLKYSPDLDADSLKNMVKEVNDTQVSRQEVLSYSPYYYDPIADRIDFLSTKQSKLN